MINPGLYFLPSEKTFIFSGLFLNYYQGFPNRRSVVFFDQLLSLNITCKKQGEVVVFTPPVFNNNLCLQKYLFLLLRYFELKSLRKKSSSLQFLSMFSDAFSK